MQADTRKISKWAQIRAHDVHKDMFVSESIHMTNTLAWRHTLSSSPFLSLVILSFFHLTFSPRALPKGQLKALRIDWKRQSKERQRGGIQMCDQNCWSTFADLFPLACEWVIESNASTVVKPITFAKQLRAELLGKSRSSWTLKCQNTGARRPQEP